MVVPPVRPTSKLLARGAALLPRWRQLVGLREERPDVHRHVAELVDGGEQRRPRLSVLVEESLGARVVPQRLELQELYSPIEEAKADVMGVYNILALVKRGKMPKELLDTLPATYLAGLFRSARFGVHEGTIQKIILRRTWWHVE